MEISSVLELPWISLYCTAAPQWNQTNASRKCVRPVPAKTKGNLCAGLYVSGGSGLPHYLALGGIFSRKLYGAEVFSQFMDGQTLILGIAFDLCGIYTRSMRLHCVQARSNQIVA